MSTTASTRDLILTGHDLYGIATPFIDPADDTPDPDGPAGGGLAPSDIQYLSRAVDTLVCDRLAAGDQPADVLHEAADMYVAYVARWSPRTPR